MRNNWKTKDNCQICGLRIDIGNNSLFVVLTEKVVHGINNVKQRKGHSWTITAQEEVIIGCRARCANSKTIEQDLK